MSGHGNQDADYLNGRTSGVPWSRSGNQSPTNESERPSVEGLMALVADYRKGGYTHKSGCKAYSNIRAYAERLCAVSAQPVATIVEMSDEQIESLAEKHLHQYPSENGREPYVWSDIHNFARAILAASRLDGPNAGEKP